METNIGGLADMLGVTTQSVREWQRTAGFPAGEQVGREKRFSVRVVLRWLCDSWRRATDTRRDSCTQDERKTRLQADKLELEIAEKRGTLVQRDAALRAVERGISESRGILLNIPHAVAALVPQDQRAGVEQRVGGLVDQALRSLSDIRIAEKMEDREDG